MLPPVLHASALSPLSFPYSYPFFLSLQLIAAAAHPSGAGYPPCGEGIHPGKEQKKGEEKGHGISFTATWMNVVVA